MHHKDSSYKLASFRWVYISGPVGDHNRNWLRPRKWAPSGGLCISQTWLRCLVITGRLCQCQPRINKSGILPPSAHTMSSSWCICHSTLKSRCLVSFVGHFYMFAGHFAAGIFPRRWPKPVPGVCFRARIWLCYASGTSLSNCFIICTWRFYTAHR